MVSAEKTPAKDPPKSGCSEGHELEHRRTGTSAGEPDPVSVPASAAGVFSPTTSLYLSNSSNS